MYNQITLQLIHYWDVRNSQLQCVYISTDYPVSPKYNCLLYDLHRILYVWLHFFLLFCVEVLGIIYLLWRQSHLRCYLFPCKDCPSHSHHGGLDWWQQEPESRSVTHERNSTEFLALYLEGSPNNSAATCARENLDRLEGGGILTLLVNVNLK